VRSSSKKSAAGKENLNVPAQLADGSSSTSKKDRKKDKDKDKDKDRKAKRVHRESKRERKERAAQPVIDLIDAF